MALTFRGFRYNLPYNKTAIQAKTEARKGGGGSEGGGSEGLEGGGGEGDGGSEGSEGGCDNGGSYNGGG